VSTVSRRIFAKKLPPGSEVVSHEGVPGVWTTDPDGERYFARLGKKPGTMMVQTQWWYGVIRLPTGERVWERLGLTKQDAEDAIADRRHAQDDATRRISGKPCVKNSRGTAPGAPKTIRKMAGLRTLLLPMEAHRSGIYFLCLADLVVYVGQSGSVLRRAAQHLRSDKLFDAIHYLPVAPEMLAETEDYFIRLLEPVFNRNKNGRLIYGKSGHKPRPSLLQDSTKPRRRKRVTRQDVRLLAGEIEYHI
jgi:hypothetical protein